MSKKKKEILDVSTQEAQTKEINEISKCVRSLILNTRNFSHVNSLIYNLIKDQAWGRNLKAQSGHWICFMYIYMYSARRTKMNQLLFWGNKESFFIQVA